jgi:asparagine synthetase B (glutamine-hydrolysing)
VLARDALGQNKLFFAIHDDQGVVVGSYLADLLAHGVPFEAIYADHDDDERIRRWQRQARPNT